MKAVDIRLLVESPILEPNRNLNNSYQQSRFFRLSRFLLLSGAVFCQGYLGIAEPALASDNFHFDRALQYQFAGNPEAAAAEYKRGLQSSPDSVDGHTRLGALLLDEVGDTDSAISEFVTALTIDPGCSYCQTRLDEAVSRKNASSKEGLARGNDFYKSGQITRSAAAYRIAVQADPNDAEIHNCLAWTLYRLGKLDEALAEVNAALRLKPAEPEYINTLACIQFDQGEVDNAISSWKKAIVGSKTPNPADLYGLALGFLSKGNQELAVKNFKEAIKSDPSYADLDYLRNKIGMSVRTLAAHETLLELSRSR